MNVLVINGHPREDSFCSAISMAYIAGAKTARAEIRYLPLAERPFNLNVTHSSPKQQVEEPVIQNARELILWANHIVFVYPTWWGTMPALLKGFIDRVFTEGFAFEETEGGAGYLPLLKGRTAEVITTMDTPKLVYHLIYRAPGHNAMRRSLLEFCGFEMSAMSAFGPVKSSTPEQRERWLASVQKRGEGLRNGALSPGKKFRIKAFAWFRAIRFQFYPMTLVAYAAGAWAANSSGYSFDAFLFWTGYGWLFFLEVATVLINEYVDYKTDNNNHYFGPFTGGSRVIVDRSLTFNDVKKGIIISLVLAVAFLAVLLVEAPTVRREIVVASLVLTVLALGYTAPPLKLVYRGLGELTVGITHSFAVILCGYLFMGGKIGDALPWLLGLPLFLAVLPSITLAGIPDYEADKLAGKERSP
ncbi:MAG: ycaK [Sphingobacteriaceae bacterium]|jgi:putative NADPH-quinone reductase/1,4-dihydroxy-2-naphthoate octaprenyltransferase|nr:ycaK [Sphingobacteriaceae bacterium]